MFENNRISKLEMQISDLERRIIQLEKETHLWAHMDWMFPLRSQPERIPVRDVINQILSHLHLRIIRHPKQEERISLESYETLEEISAKIRTEQKKKSVDNNANNAKSE